MKGTLFIAILFTAAIITSGLGQLKGQYYAPSRGDMQIKLQDSCKKVEMLTVIIDQTRILQIDDAIFDAILNDDMRDMSIRIQQRVQIEIKLKEDFNKLYPPEIK